MKRTPDDGLALMHLSETTVDKHIVANVIRTGDLTPYLDAGLTRDWLRRTDVFADTARDAYRFILDYYERHEVVPSEEIFRKNYPREAFRFPRQDYKPSQLIELVAKAVSQLALGDFSDALREFYEDEDADFAKVDAAWAVLNATRVNVAGTSSRNSWEPVDVGAWLDGDQKPLEAELGARDDGVYLLYPGKTHSLVGESEAGKSWLALLFVKQEIERGNHVYYLDFEDSLGGVMARLVELVDDARTLRQYFHYIRPEGPLTDPARLVGLVSDGSLVVVDGITEAMTMNPPKRQNNDWNANFAEFQGLLLNPIAAAGPAVLSIDHPVKNDPTARHASGAGHKLRGLSGASYVLVNQEPFGRGRRGLSTVLVAKDRHGYVRTHGSNHPDKKSHMIHIADLVIDNIDAEHAPEVFLQSPAVAGDWRPTTLMERASKALEAAEEPLSKTALQKRVTGNKTATFQAIDILIHEEYFTRTKDGRRLIFARPYTAPRDGFDDDPSPDDS